mmetsp:Transcript_99474/g.252685  ORF Transcript_99474/g.252685 Transcript_99474/m.252685 type:complete len:451 (+) Transcript_99474:404-1756(+)
MLVQLPSNLSEPLHLTAPVEVAVDDNQSALPHELPVGLGMVDLVYENSSQLYQAIVECQFEVRLKLFGEVPHEVEERRKGDFVFLVECHRVLLAEELHGTVGGAGQPLDLLGLLAELRLRALNLEVLRVQVPHGLIPRTNLLRHVGQVLIRQDLVQVLHCRPPHFFGDGSAHLLQATDVVFAFASHGLDVPDWCFTLRDLQVHQGLHHELVEDVPEAPCFLRVPEPTVFPSCLRPQLLRCSARIILFVLGHIVLLSLLQGQPQLALRRRLIGPSTTEAALPVRGQLLQAERRPSVIGLPSERRLELARTLILAVRPATFPSSGGRRSRGAGGRRPVLVHLEGQLILLLLLLYLAFFFAQQVRGHAARTLLFGGHAGHTPSPSRRRSPAGCGRRYASREHGHRGRSHPCERSFGGSPWESASRSNLRRQPPRLQGLPQRLGHQIGRGQGDP